MEFRFFDLCFNFAGKHGGRVIFGFHHIARLQVGQCGRFAIPFDPGAGIHVEDYIRTTFFGRDGYSAGGGIYGRNSSLEFASMTVKYVIRLVISYLLF
jgi:hypothetical protein